MESRFIRTLAAAIDDGSARCLATVISAEGSAPGKPGFKMLVRADGTIDGTVGGGEAEQKVIAAALADDTDGVRTLRFELKGQPDQKDGSKMVCGGSMEILLEPVGKTHQLYILGGGHCGMALSALAAQCGFAVTVIDDRPEWASKDKHPAARVVCAPYDEAARHIRFSQDASIVIMTHGHEHDERLLRDCVAREHKYLGLIASKRKVGLFFERMEKDGIKRDDLKRVYTPIGFDIGSDTPAEIAVSIVAQLVAVRSGKTEVSFNANPLR
ncbi:MAG: XdhC/CoxI family protein [Candidatus Edwardsbacteria bacterium]|jgi:xanthine dehydrogenase accessory factor|nr:XdhC/CoxI family protein [Candidatus Edwardsbacteria bacterium]